MAAKVPTPLRAAYRRNLEAYTSDMLAMAKLSASAMRHASAALLELDLEAAEEAMTESDQLIALHRRCEDRAMGLLARQNPVATELRQVLSYVHVEGDLMRMGNLGKLVAAIARQHHPEAAVPEGVRGDVVKLAHATLALAERTIDLITAPSVTEALALPGADDPVDALAHELTYRTLADDWPHSTRAAVELALLCRYYERFADHCVRIGRRVVFMVTGEQAADFAVHFDPADQEQAEHIAVLEERFAL